MTKKEEYIGDTKIISVGKEELFELEEKIPKLERQTSYKVKEFIYFYDSWAYSG